GAALGLGGAVKIFPVLLTVPAGVYLHVVKKASTTESFKPLAGAVLGFLIPTIPFLQNPLPLVDKLFYHFGNIGSFTYWTVLSVVSPPPAIPILSYGLFILLLYYTIRQSIRSGWGLFDMWMTTLLAFLSTSAKVNVQYVLWVLPLLLLHVFRRRSRDLYLNTTLLVAAGLLFILAAQTVLAIFDLRNLGRIVVSRELESLTLGGALLIFSAILGGSRFVTLVVNILRGEMKTVWTLQRITFISLFMIFALVVGILPTGQGVIVPRASVRVGVSEGIESLFDKAEEYNAEFLVSKYKLTHIVLPIGPDGILYGGDYSKSVRFKLTNSEWSKDDLKKLVESIKSAGLRPLLGVYLKTHYVSVHYGYHGFNSTHLIANFPECVSRSGNIQFNCVNSKKINLAEFFAERTAAEGVSMNFDGVYIMGVDWSRDDDLVGLRAYLTYLKKASPKGFLVFLEYDPMSSKRPLTSIESNRDLFSLVDYVVVVTNPFIRSIKEPLGGNYTVAGFKAVLENVVRSSGSRVLFTVHAMDIAEGWMTPAIQLQTEVNEFSEVDGVAGYAVYHVSRYLPVKLSLK
ncbi:MAG: hypothetical protein RMK31_08210, partial [Candidatus Caldarchaeum sp.]|nr:hypothetical protein [Candidatus Caldarchaeum sp.]